MTRLADDIRENSCGTPGKIVSLSMLNYAQETLIANQHLGNLKEPTGMYALSGRIHASQMLTRW